MNFNKKANQATLDALVEGFQSTDGIIKIDGVFGPMLLSSSGGIEGEQSPARDVMWLRGNVYKYTGHGMRSGKYRFFLVEKDGQRFYVSPDVVGEFFSCLLSRRSLAGMTLDDVPQDAFGIGHDLLIRNE